MNKPNDSGFTLIEIVIALFALGVLVTVTAPNWGSFFAQRRLEQAAWQLASDLRLTQSEAITRGSPAWITFYKFSGCYIITYPDNSTKLVELPEGVEIKSITFTSDKVTYSATGAPNAGSVHLGLQEEPYSGLYVIVTVATGRVRVSETPPET